MKIWKFLLISLFIFIFSGNVFAENLKVGVIERPPFAMKINGNWIGVSVDVAMEVAQKNNFKLDFREYKVFKNMILAVKNDELDLAAANITITSSREKEMDFSQPIYDSGLIIAVPEKESQISYWKLIWESGVIKFIGFAFLTLLIIAHILWFFERNVENQRHDYFRDEYFGGVWDAFWWAFIIMTMGGFENEVPASKFSRFLAMFWIVVSLFFVSTLTAKITSSLTISGLQSEINSYKDLRHKKVGVMTGPTVKNFLNKNNVSVIEYKNFDKLMSDLKLAKIDAVVGDAPVVSYYVNEKGDGKIKLVGEVFKPEKYGIIFPANSIYKEIFDREIIKMQEDGRYEKILEKYFGKS